MHLILASGSPRRRELLSKMGYSFETCSPDVDEHVAGTAIEAVEILAERKAREAAKHYTEGVIIASDTLVSLNGVPLGKPDTQAEARKMLHSLSGREHDVYTCVCIIDASTGKLEKRVERTGVTMRKLTDAEIGAYVDTGEPMDKAGAYAIQGGARGFVTGYNGPFDNVMGFPTQLVSEMLEDFM